MAETPVSYYPDFFCGWTPSGQDDFETEIVTARSGREERREVLRPAVIRRFVAPTDVMSIDMRYLLRSFLRARKGRSQAFYFWNPFRELYEDAAAGTVTAARHLIIPFRSSGPVTGQQTGGGGAPATIGTYKDIRLAGVSQSGYTVRRLAPRLGTFAAVRMYGLAESVSCGTNASLRALGDQAFTAWVWRSSASAADFTVISNETFNASGVVFLIQNADNKLFFRTNQAGASTSATSTGAIPNEQWTHVAVVRSGTDVTFYINGVAAGTGAGIANPVASTTAFLVGNRSGIACNGMLSEVRAYAANVTAGELANIYAGNATATSNLKGWWRLTEGTGTTAADLSGTANPGTLAASLWVGGEDEIDFGSSKTGAVTVWGYLRDRLVARDDSDSIGYQAFVSGGDLERFQLTVKELV